MAEAASIAVSEEGGASASPSSDHGPEENRLFWELITPQAVDDLWPRLEPLLRKSIEWSPHIQKLESVGDIRSKCLDGTYQAWVCIENGGLAAVLVTQVTKHSRAAVFDIHYGAGEGMRRWMKPFFDVVVADLRALGCRFIRVTGRHEWEAEFKRYGADKAASVFMLEL